MSETLHPETLPPVIQQRLRQTDPGRRDEIVRSLQANSLLIADFILRSSSEYIAIVDGLANADWPAISQQARSHTFRLASASLIASRYNPLLGLLDDEAHPGVVWSLFQDLAESWIILLGMTTRLDAPEELNELERMLTPTARLQSVLAQAPIAAWLQANSSADRSVLAQLLRGRIASTTAALDDWIGDNEP